MGQRKPVVEIAPTHRVTVAIRPPIKNRSDALGALRLAESVAPQTGWMHAKRTTVRLIVYADLPKDMGVPSTLAAFKLAAPPLWLIRWRPGMPEFEAVQDALENCRREAEHTLVYARSVTDAIEFQAAVDAVRSGEPVHFESARLLAAPVAHWPLGPLPVQKLRRASA